MRYYRPVLVSTALLLAAGNAAAYDDAYIKELEKRLEALEAKSKTHHHSKGSLELQSEETILSVGGRIRMEMAYNNPSAGGNSDIGFSPSSMTTSPEGERGELAMSLKESRFWFKTRKPTEYGMLRTLIELDFYGSEGNEKASNSHNPRLRHAYAMLGGLTLGQTNSTFMGSGVPETFHAPVSDITIRQPLVRWTTEFESGSLQIALEQPETVLDTNDSQLVPGDDHAPEFVAKYVQHGLWGELSLAIMARQFRSDSDVIADKRSTKNGGAVHLSGRLKTFGSDDFRFGIASGDGLGRYIGAGSALYAAGSIDADGEITLQNTNGGHLAYRHWWSKTLRSTVAYGYVQTENNSGVIATTDKRSASGHINIRWVPIQDGMIGLEYIQGYRELESDEEYTLDRIQAVASYNF